MSKGSRQSTSVKIFVSLCLEPVLLKPCRLHPLRHLLAAYACHSCLFLHHASAAPPPVSCCSMVWLPAFKIASSSRMKTEPHSILVQLNTCSVVLQDQVCRIHTYLKGLHMMLGGLQALQTALQVSNLQTNESGVGACHWQCDHGHLLNSTAGPADSNQLCMHDL